MVAGTGVRDPRQASAAGEMRPAGARPAPSRAPASSLGTQPVHISLHCIMWLYRGNSYQVDAALHMLTRSDQSADASASCPFLLMKVVPGSTVCVCVCVCVCVHSWRNLHRLNGFVVQMEAEHPCRQLHRPCLQLSSLRSQPS